MEILIQDNSVNPSQIKPLLPNLGRGMGLVIEPSQGATRFGHCQAFPCPLNAAFRGGSSLNGLSYHQRLTLHPYQYVQIRGEIDVAAEHVGQKAQLLLVVRLGSRWILWNQSVILCKIVRVGFYLGI